MSESKNENYNPDDFFIPDISGVSYETQRLFFNVIRDQFSDINSKEDSLPKNIFRQNYQQILMDVVVTVKRSRARNPRSIATPQRCTLTKL